MSEKKKVPPEVPYAEGLEMFELVGDQATLADPRCRFCFVHMQTGEVWLNARNCNVDPEQLRSCNGQALTILSITYIAVTKSLLSHIENFPNRLEGEVYMKAPLLCGIAANQRQKPTIHLLQMMIEGAMYAAQRAKATFPEKYGAKAGRIIVPGQ